MPVDFRNIYVTINDVQKHVYIDRRAEKDLASIPRQAQLKFRSLFNALSEKGKLEMPFGRKMDGYDNLFELRVKHQGQWRGLYTYIKGNTIIILSIFYKNTQKTARRNYIKQ